jgi:hypothetical protein
MVFVPFTLPPTPWARHPNLLAAEVDYISSCLGSLIGCLKLRYCLVLLSQTSWAHSEYFCCQICMWVCCVFWVLQFFDSLIFCLSLVCSIYGSSLALLDFDLIGTLGIGLSTMALVMVGRGDLTLGVGISLGTLGVGCWLLVNLVGEGISLGGLTILSKVTHFDVMVGTCCSVSGILFNISSIFCNASYSTIPLLFLFCFRAFVKSFRAFTIVPSGVKVGCVMYLCLKCTMSDILSLLVFLT